LQALISHEWRQASDISIISSKA